MKGVRWETVPDEDEQEAAWRAAGEQVRTPHAGSGSPTYGEGVTGSARSGPSGKAGGDGTVYSITDAGASHTDDLNKRINKYLISMAIRTACVVLAVVVDGWIRWVFIAGAVVLPYVAVLLANARDVRRGPAMAAVTLDPKVQGLGSADQPRVIYVGEPLVRHPNGGRP